MLRKIWTNFSVVSKHEHFWYTTLWDQYLNFIFISTIDYVFKKFQTKNSVKTFINIYFYNTNIKKKKTNVTPPTIDLTILPIYGLLKKLMQLSLVSNQGLQYHLHPACLSASPRYSAYNGTLPCFREILSSAFYFHFHLTLSTQIIHKLFLFLIRTHSRFNNIFP